MLRSESPKKQKTNKQKKTGSIGDPVLYVKIKPKLLFKIKLGLSVCPTQWLRAKSAKLSRGRVGLFYHSRGWGEGISRVLGPDWLTFA